ncbi:MAG: rsbU 7 [Bacteroidetes bacterium]|nr:rsbU 7 [Bacteroidota bacterium]
MNLLTVPPGLFRAFLLATAGVLLLLTSVSFYRYGSIPTDENLFTSVPSHVYALDSARITPATSKRLTRSLLPGDAIVRINDIDVTTGLNYRTVVQSTSGDSLTVTFHRLKSNLRFLGRIAARDLDSLRVVFLPPCAYVTAVTPGGASDRAGMMVGDLIVRINGQPFTTILEADRLMRLGQSGKALQYDVLRDNRPMALQVTMAAWGFPFGIIVLVASGLLWMAIGLFLGLSRLEYRGARLLGIFFLLLGFGLTVIALTREPTFDFFVVVRDIARAAAFLLAFPVGLHAEHYFPMDQPQYISRPWIRRVSYGLAVAGIALTALLGPGAFSSMLITLAVFQIVVAIVHRKEKPALAKEIMRPVKVATSVAVAGTVVVAFAATSFAVLTNSQSQTWNGFAGIPTLFIPVSYLYVIGRHRLFSLDLRIRRNLQYLFAATSWRLGTIALFGVVLIALSRWEPDVPNIQLTGSSLEVRDTPATGEEKRSLQNFLIVGAALLLTGVLWKTGALGLAFLERRYHRTGYDYRRAANELAAAMAKTQSMTELAKGVVERLAVLMRVKRAGVLFFRDEIACCGHEAFGFEGDQWKEFCIRSDRAIAGGLKRFRGPVAVTSLPPEVAEGLGRNEFAVVVPVFSKERLIGALLVGEKQSETAFHEEDFAFLTATANQAAVAIENSFLYEELAEQERMKHELSIARKIQIESLPQSTPRIEGLDIAGASLPAMEVGGDYYDYLNGNAGTLTVIVGDVSGKGTSAALYMSKVQGIMRSLHAFGLGPRELLLRANALLHGDIEKRSFVTAVGARFDTAGRNVRIARAGHLPVYHYRAGSGAVARILPRGLGLGLSANRLFDEELEEVSIPFATGDVFVFVTDGVTEAERKGLEQLGEEKVMAVLQESAAEGAAAVRDAILGAVEAFAAGEKQNDDRTVVVVRATAHPAGS